MEVVGRRGYVADDHVGFGFLVVNLVDVLRKVEHVVVGPGEESLDSGIGVLGSLTIVAMGQKDYQVATSLPLLFTSGDVLVDDSLGSVGKVSELGFPNG